MTEKAHMIWEHIRQNTQPKFERTEKFFSEKGLGVIHIKITEVMGTNYMTQGDAAE